MKTSYPCLFLLASCLFFTGCDHTPREATGSGSGKGSYDAAAYAEWEAQQAQVRKQMEDYDRQTKRIDKGHDAAERQMAKIDELAGKQEEHIKRFEKILEKWEEQAGMDAVLDKMEQDHGLKK